MFAVVEIKMPIGKIASTAGKGADYSAGSQNIQHAGELMHLRWIFCKDAANVTHHLVYCLNFSL